MELEKKARLVLEHFGREKQEEKAKEEWIDLSISLLELSKHKIKIKNDINSWNCEFMSPEEYEKDLIKNCNDELADNIFLRMQIEDRNFEETYSMETHFNYCKELLYRDYYLTNFTFDKEEVRRICEEKCERTLNRYNIKVED
jgi:UV DNA damage repair endonuclease